MHTHKVGHPMGPSRARKEALVVKLGALLPRHIGPITAVTGRGITAHVTAEQSC